MSKANANPVSTTTSEGIAAKQPSAWLNRNVFGMGLTSLLSDVGHEMVTTVLPPRWAWLRGWPMAWQRWPSWYLDGSRIVQAVASLLLSRGISSREAPDRSSQLLPAGHLCWWGARWGGLDAAFARRPGMPSSRVPFLRNRSARRSGLSALAIRWGPSWARRSLWRC